MKDPAILFYTADFLTGTILLNDEQTGKYIKLLCIQHQKGHLTEKDMLNICKTYDEDIFNKFQKDEQGLYFNVRMDTEATKRKNYAQSRRDNRMSKKEPEEIKEDVNNISESYDEHMENININKDTIIIYSKFYDLEIEKCKGKPHEANYLKAIQKIYGKFGLYGRCEKILKIKNQLTYDQFVVLVEKSFKLKLVLGDLFERFDNYEGKYKPKSVYRSLLNWMDNNFTPAK
jgi:hypothetical protein